MMQDNVAVVGDAPRKRVQVLIDRESKRVYIRESATDAQIQALLRGTEAEGWEATLLSDDAFETFVASRREAMLKNMTDEEKTRLDERQYLKALMHHLDPKGVLRASPTPKWVKPKPSLGGPGKAAHVKNRKAKRKAARKSKRKNRK